MTEDEQAEMDVLAALVRKVFAACHRYGGCELTAEETAVLADALTNVCEWCDASVLPGGARLLIEYEP